jgi:hypothetical protein
VSDGLARRGFRVRHDDPGPDTPGEQLRLTPPDDIPDVVLVTSAPAAPDAWEASVGEVLGRALTTRRNVVLFADAASPALTAQRLPADLAPLAAAPAIAYDPSRPSESIALLAHRLSSEGTVADRRLMRRAKRLFLFAGLLLLAGVALQEVPRLLERWGRPRLLDPVPAFTVYWSAIGQRLEAGRWVSFPVVDGTRVAPGDRLRVMLRPSGDGHAYVLTRHADGSLVVLFPPGGVRGASRVKAGRLQSAPAAGEWLELEAGAMPDVVYVITGYDAQQNLEELVEEPDGPADAASRRALLDATLAGLLDGRHGAAERVPRTGSLHPIDRSLPSPDVDRRVSVRLADGSVIDTTLAAQPGLASASVELRLARR